jgi:hypothetical protein
MRPVWAFPSEWDSFRVRDAGLIGFLIESTRLNFSICSNLPEGHGAATFPGGWLSILAMMLQRKHIGRAPWRTHCGICSLGMYFGPRSICDN